MTDQDRGRAPESSTIDVVVPAACDGLRVDRVVALLGGVSRAAAAEAIAVGSVLLAGEAVRTPSRRVRTGDRLVADVDAGGPARPAPDPDVVVPVVHADADVIVVDKPAGLVVHPGSGRADGTLVNGLLARYPELADVGDPERPGIVHRLDAGTTGLLVVARSAPAYAELVAQLADHSVERRYLALVWGVPESVRGLVDAPIGRSAREPTKMAVAAAGRPARTRYEVCEAFPAEPGPVALVACTLETGRTHQVRVHLAAIGHPVVGDGAYGGVRNGIEAPRPLLHATRLGFTHPRTGERLVFDAPVPADMAEVLAGLDATPPG